MNVRTLGNLGNRLCHSKQTRTEHPLSRQRQHPDRLIQDHLYLVGWVSRTLFPHLQAADREDCESVGRLALWKAAQHYDRNRGKLFYSFAQLCIQREMFRWAKSQQQDRERGLLSLDTLMPGQDGENGSTIAERVADDNALSPEAEAVKASALTQWAEVAAHLTPAQADVLRLYYGIGEEGEHAQGRTFAHVGKCLGVTSQRVHQIHQLALNRLRATPVESLLRSL